MDWSREFEIPIPLPDGRMLITLSDVAELPKHTFDAPDWQVATEALI
jgi:hypothetical protein